MTFNSISFDDLKKELLEVKAWLESLKIKDVDKSRFIDVIKFSEQLSIEWNKYKNNEPNILLNLPVEVETAVSEAMAFIHIKEGLSLLNKNHLPKKKIAKCLQGEFSSLDETKDNNEARNTLFELETACYFKICGIDVTTEFEDVNFNVENYKVSIQCKRPLVKETFKDNVVEAYGQLDSKNKILRDVNSYGFVAISLEKILKLDKVRQYKNKEELMNYLKAAYDVAMQNINLFVDEIKNDKLLGLMFFLKSPVIFKDTKMLVTVNQYMVYYPLPDINNPNGKIYQYLSPKLQSEWV